MKFQWDLTKADLNFRKHGVAFHDVAFFEFDVALETVDDRWDYGETRMIAFAPLKGELHALVYTLRNESIRLISFRRANDRERLAYERWQARR